jgi:DNA-binding transcriptional LysR family regulator
MELTAVARESNCPDRTGKAAPDSERRPAAVNAAVDGEGIVRNRLYKIEREVRNSRLVILLPEDEPPPLPVNLIVPEGRSALAKVRGFVDFTVARLRAEFASASLLKPPGRAHRARRRSGS